MSDRHSTEKLFNEMLHDYRAEILPSVAENCEVMTDVEKEQLTHMNNFFGILWDWQIVQMIK